MNSEIPKPSSRFKPKKDYHLLRQLLNEASEYHSVKLKYISEACKVEEACTQKLESLVPPHDRTVLAKYGVSCQVEQIRVSTRGFKNCAYINLTRPCTVPDRCFFGLTIGAEGPEDIGPEALPFFDKLFALSNAWDREKKDLYDWLLSFRGSKYPTWREIAEEWPIIGEYLKKRWSEPVSLSYLPKN